MPGEQLLLINPFARRGRGGRFVSGGHRKARKTPRRHRVRAHLSRSRTGRAEHVRSHMANPRRRRHRVAGYTVGNVTRHPIRRRKLNPTSNPRRRYRRNPFHMGGIGTDVMAAGGGAAGAVALNALWGYLSPHLPATLTSSAFITAASKTAAAVGLGYGVGKIAGRRNGTMVAVGAMTVIFAQLLQSMLQSAMPSIPFAGIGTTYNPSPYLNGLGAYMPAALPAPPATGTQAMHGLGAYLHGDMGPNYSDSMF